MYVLCIMTDSITLPASAARLADDQRGRLHARLRTIVGDTHVLTHANAMRRYTHGYRTGVGQAMAVVQPASPWEQWQVLQACMQAGVVVIAQASNTGLTGGSTPDGEDYDRDVIIMSTTRIRQIHLLDGGRQVVCLGGATLDRLETLLKPLGREPHSVIGSSCIGASIIGGICNNSGGSLVRRGPAYTELALYARVDDAGQLQLVNHLGLDLGGDPQEIFARLQEGRFDRAPQGLSPGAASDPRYQHDVRQVDEPSPARYNADPTRLREASGSAGKVMVFAVRLDTFEAIPNTTTFYIGSNDPRTLTRVRRHVLTQLPSLPIAGEYLHRDAYDIAKVYGKDLFVLIERLGTRHLPKFFNIKSRIDAWQESRAWVPRHLTDRLLQWASRWFPNPLPARMEAYRDQYVHHLILKVDQAGADALRGQLPALLQADGSDCFECTPQEATKAFLHRFAAASAAIRYRAIHSDDIEDIIALDIALRRNDEDWEETLPASMDAAIEHKLYYGHFLCHVFHQDYTVRKGHDIHAIEHAMHELLDQRGARYPAEHNVGHLYEAAPAQQAFYRELDPCNCFNPGIGHQSKLFRHGLGEALEHARATGDVTTPDIEAAAPH